MDSRANQLAPINFDEGYMLGQQPHEMGLRSSTYIEFSKWLNVRLDLQGAELIDPTPAGTSENPAVISPGPEDRKGKFEPEPGFYQGFPELTADKRYYFYWDKNNWTLWDLGPLPKSTGTNEVVEGGSELLNQDGGFKIEERFSDKISSVASFEALEVPVFDGGTGSTQYDTPTDVFRGWGTNYGILEPFNRIKVRFKSNNNPSTKLKYRICENDRNGAVLASGEIAIDIQVGDTKEFPIDLGATVESESNIWFESSADGNMGLIKTQGSYVSRKLRYQSSTMNYSDNFAQNSLETSISFTEIPDIVFLRVSEKAIPSIEFSQTVLSQNALGKLELGDERAPKAEDVKIAISPFEDVIEGSYVPETTEVISGGDVLTNSSTFGGYGEKIGVKKNFDTVQYDVMAYDAENIPNYMEMRIRNGNREGAILYNVRVELDLQPNVRKSTQFRLGELFENAGNLDLFVQFNADGYFSLIGSLTGSPINSVKYTTAKGTSTVPAQVSGYQKMGLVLMKGSEKGALKSDVVDQLRTEILGESKDPDLVLTSRAWVFPTFELNIFNKNICVPKYGYKGDGYVLDYSGNIGKQLKRCFRLENATAGLDTSINLELSRDRKVISTKSQRILSGAINNGNDKVINVGYMADSTNIGVIPEKLTAIFQNDVMKVNNQGTLGIAPNRHEGRGGWGFVDYIGVGRTLYKINVTGISVNPSIGSVYTQGGKNLTVREVNITGGIGYFSVENTANTGGPTSSGTLTKVSGNGDATISYSSFTTTSLNPFYNPTTQKFDFNYYVTTNGFMFNVGDWFFIQLGINDLFNLTTESAITAKVSQMMGWLNEIITSIHSYNSGIRIGIAVTFPPSSQDGFGENYNLGQTYEIYRKLCIPQWQKALIDTYDNEVSRTQNIFLLPLHQNLDCDYNYPNDFGLPNSRYTGTQREFRLGNAVHPNDDGNYQNADMYAGIIKYFG